MIVYVFEGGRVSELFYTDKRYAHMGHYKLIKLSNPCEACGCGEVIEKRKESLYHKGSMKYMECEYCEIYYCTLEQQEYNKQHFLGNEKGTSFAERGFETGD